MNTHLIIPAAGLGKRLGRSEPKALVELAGEPLLVHTLRRFASLHLIDGATIMIPLHQESGFRKVLDAAFPRAQIQLVPGGAERQDSVARGLDALATNDGIVVIHDAARPFVDPAVVREAISEARKHGAATVAMPCADTILEADDRPTLLRTPDRKHLWACQTPQVFRLDLLRDAHKHAHARGLKFTDDATLVRETGATVHIVASTARNFKVTTADDLRYAAFLLEQESK